MRIVNDSIEGRLWTAYASTVFWVGQPHGWRGDFAIITACNPAGQLLSPGANRIRDRQLQRELANCRVPHLRVIGAAPDHSHHEQSWAVWLPVVEANQIAAQFQQNAMFYVEQQRLWLLPCLMAGERRDLGPLAPRLRPLA